jgi:hypothetical protein
MIKNNNSSKPVICMALIFLSTILVISAAYAQGLHRAEYVTPFPKGDDYELFVFGDSIAVGVWEGLAQSFTKADDIKLVKKARASTGLSRSDVYNWHTALETFLRTSEVNIAVVVFGANDAQTLVTGKKRVKFNENKWRKAYGKKVEDFITRLKQSGAAVYWVGLPIMRSAKFNEKMQLLNDIYREKTHLSDIKFIDTWNAFTDQFGRYSAYGLDLDGRVRKLRSRDGIHFTASGYRKLAHFVEQEIKRDLRIARRARNVPLAGDAQEQRRATGERISRKKSPTVTEKKNSDMKKPGAQSASYRKKAFGETITAEIEGGLTALSSISPEASMLKSSIHNLPEKQRPYNRVLREGERLPSVTGRADDFAWQSG